jgi:hypothetical protein
MALAERMYALWMDGHSVRHIATKLRVSPTTVYRALRQATPNMEFPKRPWAGAATLGISAATLMSWVRDGLVRHRPGVYNTDDVARHIAHTKERQCAHWKCERAVDSVNRHIKFCGEHVRIGVDPDYVLKIISRYPGIGAADVYNKLGVTSTSARPVLMDLVEQGLLRDEPTARNNGHRYFVVKADPPDPTPLP